MERLCKALYQTQTRDTRAIEKASAHWDEAKDAVPYEFCGNRLVG
jgi:hypothetical protein